MKYIIIYFTLLSRPRQAFTLRFVLRFVLRFTHRIVRWTKIPYFCTMRQP